MEKPIDFSQIPIKGLLLEIDLSDTQAVSATIAYLIENSKTPLVAVDRIKLYKEVRQYGYDIKEGKIDDGLHMAKRTVDRLLSEHGHYRYGDN